MPTATELPSPHFADPDRCPDCRRLLPTDQRGRCGSCGLPLQGPTAADLFTTLRRADLLLARLRRQETPSAPSVPSVPAAAVPPARDRIPPYPTGERGAPAPARPPLDGPGPWTVPGVLLALGALCLLVGAVVFLAVTWAMLGVGGRTAVLVGVTALAGTATTATATHGLRGGAEALAVVSGALLALDVAGAFHAGWLGDVPAVTAMTAGALAVAVVLVAATHLLHSAPTGRLVAPQVLAGTAVVVATVAALARFGGALTTTAVLEVVLLMGAAVAARRGHQPVLAIGLLVAASGAWLSLPAEAGLRVLQSEARETVATWGDVVPALWAAALLGLLALPVPPTIVRRAGVVGALALVGLATVLAVVTGPDGLVGVAAAGVVACTVLAIVGPGRWSAPAFATAAAGYALVGLVPVLVTVAGLAAAVGTAVETSRGRPGGLTVAARPGAETLACSPWMIPIGVGGLALVIVAFGRRPRPGRWTLALLGLPVAGVSVLGAAPVLLLAVVLTLALAALHCYAAWRRTTWWGREADVVAAVCWALLAGDIATYHPLPALTVAAAYAVVATIGALRGLAALAVVSPVLVAAAGGALGWLTGWPPTWVASAIAVVVAAHGVVLGLIGRWRGTPAVARLCLYVAALPTAILAGLVSASAAQPDAVADRMVATLVVTGCATAGVGILERSREAGWLAAGLQLGALWLRLADRDVATTEAYTLPLAGVLLAFGAWTMWRDPRTGSMGGLLPGLGTALLPTLVVVVLGDPVSLRAGFLALGCAAALLVGAAGRLRAPLLAGGTVGAILVLVELAPYHDAVPRWLALGVAGSVLLAAGIRWEHLAGAGRRAWGRVASLR